MTLSNSMGGTEPNGLQYRFVDSDQYDDIDYDEQSLQKILDSLAEPIGSVLVAFSELDHELDLSISEFINERADQLGITVVKSLEFAQKVELYRDLALSVVIYFDPDMGHRLKSLRKGLMYMAELRNVVAHAKWISVTRDGYVRSQVRINKESGWPEHKCYKLNKVVLKRMAKNISNHREILRSLHGELYDFLDM